MFVSIVTDVAIGVHFYEFNRALQLHILADVMSKALAWVSAETVQGGCTSIFKNYPFAQLHGTWTL